MEQAETRLPVSVILAAYRSPWLRDAIESVIRQTTDSWELIVLDDANSAEACSIVCSLGDDRVRYLSNTKPLGPALNHQRGIDEARFDHVAFINHDDLWDPTLLVKLTVPFVRDPSMAVCFSDHWIIRENGTIDEVATEASAAAFHRADLAPGVHHDIEELAIVNKAIPVAQCAVICKASIPRLPRWVGGAYDFYVSTRLSHERAYYVSERLASFRVHGTNLGLQRSPVRDLVLARIYAGVVRGSSQATSRYALREAARAGSRTPQSTLRWCQSYLRNRRFGRQ